MADNLKFIVTLTEHRLLGNVFLPCLADDRQSCLVITSVIRPGEMEKLGFPFMEREKEIIRLAGKTSGSSLASRFSRESNAQDFLSTVDADFLKRHVLPYVEKQMYRIAMILRSEKMPLYRKEAKYSHVYEEDLIQVYETCTFALFEFSRHMEGTDYRLRIMQDEREIRLLNRKVEVVTNDPCILLLNQQLLVFSGLDAKKLLPFLNREVIHIPRQMEEKYFRNFVSGVVAEHEVLASGFTIIDIFPEPEVFLSLEPDLGYQPVFVLKFSYSGVELLHNDQRKQIIQSDLSGTEYAFTRIHRNLGREVEIAAFLASLGLKEKSGTYSLPNLKLLGNEQAVYCMIAWLSDHLKVFEERGIVIRQQSFTKRYFTGKCEVKLEIKGKSDWFDVYAEVKLGDFQFPFVKLRKYILNDIREFELPDGEIAILPEEWFSQYKMLFPFARGEGYMLNFQRHHFSLLGSWENLVNPEKLAELRNLTEVSMEIQPPPELQADLRSYQLTGYRWLYSLFRNGLGGCLADDMGLGKTIQTIAFLLKTGKLRSRSVMDNTGYTGQLSLFGDSDAEAFQPASLIVMPTSLVHNWESEIARFAPSLKVYKHIGVQRVNAWKNNCPLKNADVILTTYGTIRNDTEVLEDAEFFILILDESQYIKNPLSKTYKAVASLKSKHRMVLTGTPVENSLSDLWAQMNFLNRGLLGSFLFFKQNFITPVENHGDPAVIEKLRLLIRPFILRRTKEEVASDLPALMEQTVYCTMTPEQESMYEQEKSVIRNTILSAIENEGISKSSIVILQGLTRLRQLANHPRLLLPDSRDESGKFGEIMESLGNIVAENHKVLVFSSFVTHLDLVAEELENRKWKYSLLTGKSQNRKEIISRFQEDDENHIFLISLKAGGVGLNLTRADYVFILDPWWNPAVESQAVSRAHRIGQERHVFVYRFITENSVEEKIVRLKERKSELADTFINQNDPFMKWTEEEILSFF